MEIRPARMGDIPAMAELINDIKRVFCLTREPKFFENLGFARLERNKLPHKVWSDCVNCPVKDNCDEIALLLDL